MRHIIIAGFLMGASLSVATAHAAQRPDRAAGADLENFSLRLDYTRSAMQRDRRSVTKYAQQQSQRRISASQAKSIALGQVRGATFINVQLISADTYRVRLKQNNGRIIDVYVDAHTGRVRK